MPSRNERPASEFDGHEPAEGLTDVTLAEGFTEKDLFDAMDLGARIAETRRRRTQHLPEGESFGYEDL